MPLRKLHRNSNLPVVVTRWVGWPLNNNQRLFQCPAGCFSPNTSHFSLISGGRVMIYLGFPHLSPMTLVVNSVQSELAWSPHLLPMNALRLWGLVPANVWWDKSAGKAGTLVPLFMRLKEATSSPLFPWMLSYLDMMPGTAAVTLWPWGAVRRG